MKMIVFILVTAILNVQSLSQELVNIPDTHFLAALIEKGVDADEDGYISHEEAEAVTELNLANNNLKELDLSKQAKLLYLDLNHTYISDLNISSFNYVLNR